MLNLNQDGDAGASLCEAAFLGLASMDFELSKQAPSTQLVPASVQLGSVSLFRYAGEGVHRACRRWEHIREDGLDCYVVQLPQSARLTIGHRETESMVDPGSFAIQSTTRPFQVVANSATASCEPFESVHIWIPGPLLRSRIPHIEDICNRSYPIVPGASRIMLTMAESALLDGPALSSTHAASFGVDILGAVVRAGEAVFETRAASATLRETSLARIFERAVSFIEANLSNPSIDTSAIAEHCRISVRYLHAAFESRGETVAARIRERRLQLCRQALCHPGGRSRSIVEISTDWGFTDPSHFSHAYKTRFGIAPSKERLM